MKVSRRRLVQLFTFSLLACGRSQSGDRPLEPTVDAGVELDSTADASTTDGAPSEACPRSGPTTIPGAVTAPAIDEASGIVASDRNDDTFWIHNDSGDAARVFAINGKGALLATLVYDQAKPEDVEDIAIEDVSPDNSYLYLGDIGDNDSVRKEIVIHRMTEPKLNGTPNAELSTASETMRVTYADGPHNAETLLFDPVTKDLLIATKVLGGPSDIYRAGIFSAGGKATAEKIASVDVNFATGGDISRDGRLIALRNYGASAFVWLRAPGESVAAALARAPCNVSVAKEGQGEAFGFLLDSRGYVTVSEGVSQDLHVTLFQP